MKKRYVFLTVFLGLVFFILGFFASIVLINYKDGYVNSEKEHIPVDNEIGDKINEEIEVEIEIEEPRISNIKILAVGDLMFHQPQYKSAYDKENETYDFSPNFKYVKKHIENAHISIGNFETVTREDVPFSGYPRFNTPKASLLAIKDAGFDILSTANNHTLDQGKQGIIDTIDNIKINHMVNIGSYKSKEENTIYIREIDSIRIGLLAYTYGLNGLDSLLTKEELSYMVNLIDEEKIEADLLNAKTLALDLIIVSIHWGNEYQREPSRSQMELGEKMINWGADIILGSHPHVIQRSEIINKDDKDKFIIYSLGNFISNQRKETSVGNPYTEDGIMVEFEIEKDSRSQETIIKSLNYIPTWVYRYRDENRLHYEILPIEDILSENIETGKYNNIKDRIEKSYKDTMDKMENLP